jgi:uncharacterized repeat protein (TIGR03803 family)
LDTAGHETVLYNFCAAPNCADGWAPSFGVIRDAAGNLYGSASQGLSNAEVFKVDTAGQEAVLSSQFVGDVHGLIQDAAGNLYGTSSVGGAHGSGMVFKLDATDQVTELYSFCSSANCADGEQPQDTLLRDAAGNLYGTTQYGGGNICIPHSCGYGTVFKLDTSGRETVLYSFGSVSNHPDGIMPWGGLIQDAAGNLYGTTSEGGMNSSGAVFKLDATGQETLLYNFCSASNCADGGLPTAGLIQDATGNLYGTTTLFGANGHGTVFKVTFIPPSFSVGATGVSISPGATSGNTSIVTLTPTGGFTGSVVLTAAIASSPTGAQDLPTLSFGATSPVTINSASPETATLTISTTAATVGALAYPSQRRGRWRIVGGMGLALVLFVGIPSRSRSWRTSLGLLFSFILISGLSACGGGSGGSRGGNVGTTSGNYTVTVTATSGSTMATSTVKLTVQ